MSEVARWGLIGPGNVGKEVLRQIDQPHVAERLGISQLPEFIMRSTGIYDAYGNRTEHSSLAEIEDFPDVTFIATPSMEGKEEVLGYVEHIMERGKIAVTAEKGTIANHYTRLRDISDNFAHLGINATVGGGTRLIEVLKRYCTDRDNITQLHLVLNGTLSSIMSLIAPPDGLGMSLGQSVHQSVQLGYAEPGASTPYDVIKGEAEGDIPKKTAILFNALNLGEGEVLDWRSLRFELTGDVIARAVEEARVRRFIVSMYSPMYVSKMAKCPEDDIIGGFTAEFSDWLLVGGFRHLDRNPLFSHLSKITGPGNGFVIGLGPDETDGVYSLVGPGAGVRPTANTMIDDYVDKKRSL